MNNYHYSHRERLEDCLVGHSLDRVPVAFWRHFPVDDQTPDGLAAATTAFQNQYAFDMIKVSPASSFCLKDWGVEDRWIGNLEGTRDYQKYAIQKPEDWFKLSILDPNRGHLADQLDCLRMISGRFSPHTPIIQTIFSPLSQAKNLIGSQNLIVQMRCFPDALQSGLEIITKTTIRFIEESIKRGIDGIFYAIQHAQYILLSKTEFMTFCKSYDLRILEVANQLWLNMVHIHGEDIMFDEVKDYPVAIMNWHDRLTPPSLNEAQTKFKGVVCGGLQRWKTMVNGNPQLVQEEAKEAILATNRKRFILGSGCVLPIITPHGNILAACRSAYNQLSK